MVANKENWPLMFPEIHIAISTARRPSDGFSDQPQLWLAVLRKRKSIFIKVWLDLSRQELTQT